MAQTLAITDFLQASGVLLDARSPAEYEQGHIPGAISFPLFDNAERAQVGTCYKQEGREAAIELGLDLVGLRLRQFVTTAKELAPDRQVRLHCWRGGMRSGSLGWLLETAGLEVRLLEGGYKSFRRWVRSTLITPRPLRILGGMTGTGKTDILHALADLGEQVLDLEQLAHHRGSSYGSLGLPPQPSNEQFENRIAVQLAALAPDRPVWIEAESRRVGICRIPDELFVPMLKTPVIQVERPLSERIDRLLEDYGNADREALITATQRIQKKLGGQHAKAAIESIRQGDLAPAIACVLNYYDKTYTFDLHRRGVPIHSVDITGLSARESALRVLTQTQRLGADGLEGSGCDRPIHQQAISVHGKSV